MIDATEGSALGKAKRSGGLTLNLLMKLQEHVMWVRSTLWTSLFINQCRF